VIGLFVFGCFVTAIVATACGLIVAGIREADQELKQREDKDFAG
jgi:biopolymer transport protein ExbB/TolQ